MFLDVNLQKVSRGRGVKVSSKKLGSSRGLLIKTYVFKTITTKIKNYHNFINSGFLYLALALTFMHNQSLET